jgi:hypothetical protein
MATFVAALSLLSACSGAPTPAPSIEASPDRSTPETTTAPEADGDADPDTDELTSDDPPTTLAAEEELGRSTVTLLDVGEEPHRELRYAFSQTQTPVAGTFTATYGVSGTDAAGEPLPDRAPVTVAAPTEVAVVEVDDDGTATVTFGYGSAEVTDPGGLEGPELAAVESTLEALAEVQATYRVDDRGFVTLLDADAPDTDERAGGTDVTAIARRVPAFVQPLPAEPVGVGARWTVTTAIEVGGLPVVHTVSVELLERDGELLELLFTIDEADPAAGSEDVDPSADRTLTISSLSVDGGGNVTTRLDRPVPIGAAKGLTAELQLELTRGDERTRFDRTILSDASLETDG